MQSPETITQLNEDLRHALGGFARYMNEPLRRVHVFTWSVACKLRPDGGPVHGIRLLPAFRYPEVSEWRLEVARFIKMIRQYRADNWRSRRLALPIYNESTGKYESPKTT